MFISAVLFPVFLVISMIGDEGAPMIVPFMLFFVGLTIMLYSRLFGETIAPVSKQPFQTSGLGSMAERGALPPASNIPMYVPANPAAQRVKTSELDHPPSVTEHTTKLLDQD
jgi:hypothetical protein